MIRIVSIILFSFFLMAVPSIVRAQTWNNIYGVINSNGDNQFDTDISRYIYGNQTHLDFFYSNQDSLNGYWSQVFMRVDLNGNEMFRKEYEIPLQHWVPGWWTTADKCEDGGYVQSGYTGYYDGLLGGRGVNPVLCKFNSEGDTLWRKVYPRDKWAGGDKVIECVNGDFAIIGRTEFDTIVGNPQVFFMRTDALGNVLWEKSYGDSTEIGEYGVSVVEIPNDGGFFLSGTWRIPPNSDAMLMKVDAEGNELWLEHFGWSDGDESSHVLGTASDGNYYLVGSQGVGGDHWNTLRRARIRKFDVDGSMIWETLIGDFPNERNYFTAVKESFDQQVVCSGIFWNDTLGQMGGIAKFDSQTGDSLWLRTYRYVDDPYSTQELYDIALMPDGGYAMAGHVWQSPENPYVTDDAWVIKVDEYGCLEPGCEALGLSDLVMGLENSMHIYPNPLAAHQPLNISFKNNGVINMPYAQEATSLIITDALGRTIAERSIPKQGHSNDFILQWDVSLSAGQYIIHWTNNRTWFDSIQMIVE